MQATARQSFEKLGDTRFVISSFAWNNPEDRFIRVSALNELRRQVLQAMEAGLDAARNESNDLIKTRIRSPASLPAQAGGEFWSLKTDRLEHLAAFEAEDWQGMDEVVVDIGSESVDALEKKLGEWSEKTGCDFIRLALPLITRKWEEASLHDKIKRLRNAGWNKWEGANVSAWTLLGMYPQAEAAAWLNSVSGSMGGSPFGRPGDSGDTQDDNPEDNGETNGDATPPSSEGDTSGTPKSGPDQ